MFHSKKLITEAVLPSPEQSSTVIALPPKARPPSRRPLWLAFGGLAIAATVGTGWLMARPACSCALPPIKPINLKSQATPVGSTLANKGSSSRSAVLRPAAMQPGDGTPLLNQPVQAGSGVAH